MKEENISETIMNALENSNKAKASEAFLVKMENVALAYSNKVASFSRQTLIGIAASFLVLIAANLYAVNKYNSQSIDPIEVASSEAYNLIPTKSLYE